MKFSVEKKAFSCYNNELQGMKVFISLGFGKVTNRYVLYVILGRKNHFSENSEK